MKRRDRDGILPPYLADWEVAEAMGMTFAQWAAARRDWTLSNPGILSPADRIAEDRRVRRWLIMRGQRP